MQYPYIHDIKNSCLLDDKEGADMKCGKGNIKKLVKSESGIILIIAITLLAIMALLGTVAVKSTTTDLKISANLQSATSAFYSAEAGLEETRGRLRSSLPAGDYIGDTSLPPNGLWTAYIGTVTAGVWNPVGIDPDYDVLTTNDVYDSSQNDLSYWAKARHKKESDILTGFETYTDNIGDPGTDDIIYYGYSTTTASTFTLGSFTTDDVNLAIMSPVEIVSAYGSSSDSSSFLEIHVRRGVSPPIAGALYGNNVDLAGNVDIVGDDNCSSGAVPATAYSAGSSTSGAAIDLESAAGESAQLDTALDIASLVDALQPQATVVLTADTTSYEGDSSQYEIVYVDATALTPDAEFDFKTASGGGPIGAIGYGTLVVRGDMSFGSNTDWRGLIIISGNLTLSGGGTVFGAIMANDTASASGTPDITYDSCEILNASGGYIYSVDAWKDDALD